MKYIKYLIVGVFFGIILSKAEVISWFRIYEMFKFQSFHMYGIIGSAVAIGLIIMQLFKSGKLKTINGDFVQVAPKEKGIAKNLLGGIIFGLGWALGGACPGPMFILVGYGFASILIVIVGALLGAMLYHQFKRYLPH